MNNNDGNRWISDEFSGMDLGDERLNKRAKTLMADLAAKPSASIPVACNGWSETLAAYRFLGNDQVDWREIMAPHWSRTEARMGAHPVVLCLQDTTELEFNGQQIAGLGPLNYEARRGMYVHPTYAVTPQREALGVLDAWMWAREHRDEHGERGGVLESARWIEGYERVAELAATLGQTRLVYVADREADMVDLMLAAERLERALALFMVVSWRIMHLMQAGRSCPDLDAHLFFDPDEIRGTYLLAKRKPPAAPPTVNDVLRLIATLGGFLARKGDGEPGVETIRLGLQRTRDAAITIQSLRDEAADGSCV